MGQAEFARDVGRVQTREGRSSAAEFINRHSPPNNVRTGATSIRNVAMGLRRSECIRGVLVGAPRIQSLAFIA